MRICVWEAKIIEIIVNSTNLAKVKIFLFIKNLFDIYYEIFALLFSNENLLCLQTTIKFRKSRRKGTQDFSIFWNLAFPWVYDASLFIQSRKDARTLGFLIKISGFQLSNQKNLHRSRQTWKSGAKILKITKKGEALAFEIQFPFW